MFCCHCTEEQQNSKRFFLDDAETRGYFYLPYILTISSISPLLSVCSVGNPFKKSFQIIRYNIHMSCCHITFKYQNY